MPVTVAVMEPGARKSTPVTRWPRTSLLPERCVHARIQFPYFRPPGPRYYINYTSERPVAISLAFLSHGSNGIWRGGWVSNAYSDTVVVETANGEKGSMRGKGN